MAQGTTRRRTLKLVIATGAAALCTAALAPPIAFVVAPARGAGRGRARWISTVKLSALPDGVPKRVHIVSDERDAWKLERDAEVGGVWLVRSGDAVKAFSTVCPHLGCVIDVSVRALEEGFVCPCHDSRFDADGKRLDGPAPRDMDTLATRVVLGVVEVDFRRYRQGTADRVELG